MAILMGSPKPSSFPSGRYERTNPLRRYAGLRLLSEPLPERLRWAIIRAWRQPSYFEVGMTALPGLHRQRPGEAQIISANVHRIALFFLTELEVSRRVVEAPQVSIKPEERNRLLSAQGAYLRRLYVALARQVGTEHALAICEQAIEAVG
ncbi:MAG TPA: hypothetical protein VFU69_09280 [Ktedonobacterales bacterium]|nr:hypothetical protein [Ktedonobacterales bacterium]